MDETSLLLEFEFLDEVYVGRDFRGHAEQFPDPLRLHSALLAMASTGPSAEPAVHVLDAQGDVDWTRSHIRQASRAARAALEWLESHPPEQIVLPEFISGPHERQHFVARDRARKTKKEGQRYQIADSAMLNRGQSCHGTLGYRWEQVPAEYAATLSSLTSELAYLGESTSRVLGVGHFPAPEIVVSGDRVLTRDASAGWATRGLQRVGAPAPGRTEALIEAVATHHQVAGGVRSESRNKAMLTHTFAVSARGSVVDTARRAHRREVAYRSGRVSPPVTAFDAVFTVGLHREIEPEEHVEIALRAHRALVRAMGTAQLPVVTGHYPAGTEPANHLSIQVLPGRFFQSPASVGLDLEVEVPAVLVFALPSGCPEVEVDAVAAGIAAMCSAVGTTRHGGALFAGRRSDQIVGGVAPVYLLAMSSRLSAADFWGPAPDPEAGREWVTYPVAITERNGGDLEDALSASVVLATRNQVFERAGLRADLRGRLAQHTMRDQIAEAARAVAVGSVRKVPVAVGSYVYKTNAKLAPVAYQGCLRTDLIGDRELIAIGQSRHLGGGLLVPAEVMFA